ncbi:MAG: hypothetical protein OEP52_02140 [Acidimicrobiia bacterium]|nr:hypothetical protein [Acidimicrobiia bacterium]
MNDPRALVESLLAAKLYLSPQIAGDRLYFISNRTGHMSLFAMPLAGGEAVQLVPEDLALPSPKVMASEPYSVIPALGKILVTIDDHGNENYQPYFIPIEGGVPEPVWGDRFAGQQVFSFADRTDQRAILVVSPRTDPNYASYLADLTTLELTELGTSPYGNFPIGRNESWIRLPSSTATPPGTPSSSCGRRRPGAVATWPGSRSKSAATSRCLPPGSPTATFGMMPSSS